jgi:hypothetical protein
MRLIDTTPFDIKFMDIPDGTEDYKQGYMDGAWHVLEEMDESPTVDAMPVVRCKDCKHWFGPNDGSQHSCDLDALMRSSDWFCAGGGTK